MASAKDEITHHTAVLRLGRQGRKSEREIRLRSNDMLPRSHANEIKIRAEWMPALVVGYHDMQGIAEKNQDPPSLQISMHFLELLQRSGHFTFFNSFMLQKGTFKSFNDTKKEEKYGEKWRSTFLQSLHKSRYVRYVESAKLQSCNSPSRQ